MVRSLENYRIFVTSTMFSHTSLEDEYGAELPRPKLKADDDLEKSNVWGTWWWSDVQQPQRQQAEDVGGVVVRRSVYVFVVALLALALFAVPSDFYSEDGRTSGMIDYARLRGVKVKKRPFFHVICKNAIAMPTLRKINADFPPSLKSKVHVDEEDLVAAGEIKGKFADLLDELRGAEMKRTLEGLFDVDLANTFTRVTLR